MGNTNSINPCLTKLVQHSEGPRSLLEMFDVSVVSPADITSALGDHFAIAAFQAVQTSSCSAPKGAGSLIAHY